MFKEKGMWDNTLMVLTTDNGGYTKSTGVCNKSDKTKVSLFHSTTPVMAALVLA